MFYKRLLTVMSVISVILLLISIPRIVEARHAIILFKKIDRSIHQGCVEFNQPYCKIGK